MSAEQTTDTTAPRLTAEEWVERVATYWTRAAIDAWRTVFPRREGNR